MLTRTLIVSALIGAGVLGATVVDEYRLSQSGDQSLLAATIAQPYCGTQPGAPAMRTFFRMAMAAQADAAAKPPPTEVGPFSRAVADAASIAQADADPVLATDLGTLHYPISTSVPRAQQYFDQGLRLSFAFNHGEAVRAFRKARTLDPECAMCYWGEALVLGPHINAPMDAAAVGPAFEAVSRAQALAARAGAKERALIEALAARYAREAPADRAALDRAYADAMERVAARHPDDAHIAVLTAEALMDLQPWDYWESGGFRAKGRSADILALLERVLKKAPDHPGAIHFYIHMTENSSDPARALPYAQRLGRLMPGAGHVVHMPFHTYFRVGMYKEAVEANRQAVRADEAYIARSAPTGIYPVAYYPHNVHSLMASAQMAGDGATAIDAATKLDQIVSTAMAKQVAWVQPIKVAPYFTHAQFSAPQTILALPDPGPELPYVQAMWHYARGVGLAQRGDRSAARLEADAIARIAQANAFTELAAIGIPAKDVLRLAEQIVLGRIAQAGDDHAGAVRHFQAAVELEDSLAYTEPPYWYYPTRQSLGAALLRAGRVDEAEDVLRSSLARAPNNGWALFGLMKVYDQRGDRASSRTVARLLERAWLGDRKMLTLARL